MTYVDLTINVTKNVPAPVTNSTKTPTSTVSQENPSGPAIDCLNGVTEHPGDNQFCKDWDFQFSAVSYYNGSAIMNIFNAYGDANDPYGSMARIVSIAPGATYTIYNAYDNYTKYTINIHVNKVYQAHTYASAEDYVNFSVSVTPQASPESTTSVAPTTIAGTTSVAQTSSGQNGSGNVIGDLINAIISFLRHL